MSGGFNVSAAGNLSTGSVSKNDGSQKSKEFNSNNSIFEKLFKGIDADGDGKITKKDQAIINKALDKNGDTNPKLKEFSEALNLLPEEQQNKMQQFIGNAFKDGKEVSKEDFHQLYKQMQDTEIKKEAPRYI